MVNSSMIPSLRDQAESSDPRERQQAIVTLKEFRGTQTSGVASNIILNLIEDENIMIRQMAQDALLDFGIVGIEKLVQLIYCNDFDIDDRATLVAHKLLIKFGSKALESLIKTLTIGDICAKSEAAIILGELGDLRAIEPLYAELNKNSILFMNVVESISKLRGISLTAQLRELLLSSDDLIRDKARKELQKILDVSDSLENNGQKINEPTKYDRTLFDM